MDTLELRIDSLAYGGNGVGRHEGIVYFVPFSVPGDLLEVRVTKQEKRFREAEIVRIIEASPDRVEPPCPYSGECGGCQWQQVNYKTQTEQKVNELRSALIKNRLNDLADMINPITESPKQLGYRRTARFKTVTSEDGSQEYGFYRAGSNELIKIERCMLLDDRINDFLPQVRLGNPGLVGFDLFMDEGGAVNPFYRFSEKDLGADFFQVNEAVNDKLLTYIRETVKKYTAGKHPRILDLYCGDGNLSLQLADYAASVTGWDNSKTAIERGRKRAEVLREEYPKFRTKFFEADVARSWKNIAGWAKQTDCIILDPPRRGLKNQTSRLAGLNVPLIVYISCSPPALIRDVAALQKAGYRVESLQPFDMFPQTYHLETVAVLRK
ncbi:MAG: class I SAM-dependent RNA methyltransferase [Spirochaetales bacterium]|uniref:Class I SAM-dependent RNA methyltransferase n=1 Tax=Candidatus Thalassospirochaeta sargassi TaxID=3119039 RepID=A0AAJ1MMF5_9SPIO|nr:class I SAM-dependent RNA methyltransferase [Spirochaetales bacterium]